MKLRFQWKDPGWDYAAEDADLSKEQWHLIHQKGLGEYVVIEYDTDTTIARLLPDAEAWVDWRDIK